VIVYFAAQPKLQLQYCGIVDAPLPGLAKRVQSAVDSWTKFGNAAVASMKNASPPLKWILDFLHHFLGPSKDWLFSNVVLPNFKCIEITSDERMLSLAACTREPIGVLKVHVCRGINLAGRAGWSVSAVPRQICYVHLLGWKTTSQDMVQNPAFSANIQR